MLSKEEIEKLLSCDNCNLKECINCEMSYTVRQMIREYIEQLETDKQKLIEKLEKVDDEMADFETISLKYEILEILKGE